MTPSAKSFDATRHSKKSSSASTVKPRFAPSLLLFQGVRTMRVLYINNDGGGFADHINVDEGTTVASLFTQRLPGRKPEDYLIRVNRQPASADQILQEG